VEEEIVEYSKQIGKMIMEEFLKEYSTILNEKEFKIEMNNLKEGKETKLTEEEISSKFSNFKKVLVDLKIIE
jgi:spore cortex formation protein SpoVR/YcgB (stage V sporulation)